MGILKDRYLQSYFQFLIHIYFLLKEDSESFVLIIECFWVYLLLIIFANNDENNFFIFFSCVVANKILCTFIAVLYLSLSYCEFLNFLNYYFKTLLVVKGSELWAVNRQSGEIIKEANSYLWHKPLPDNKSAI